ncbi:unnamed protein product [Cochlearia groenlandica]
MSFKRGGGNGDNYFAPRNVISRNWTLLLCLASFSLGMFFTNRIWTVPEARSTPRISKLRNTQLNLTSSIGYKIHYMFNNVAIYIHIYVLTYCIKTMIDDYIYVIYMLIRINRILDKSITSLEMKLVAAKSERESFLGKFNITKQTQRRKYFMVVGINTAFSSRKRRDSVRATWMPQGEKLKKLEEEKGIVVRFVIGHSESLDKSIEDEEKIHGDFLRLEHVEGYMKLSAKTKTYFATAVSLWDAEFYIKVDDDVHVNLATLGMTLQEYRNKPRVYAGCMKSGPVLAKKGVRYHEPEYWKFGEPGNNYFRHATGQLYALSKDLATYILVNQNLLHKYANEDVSLGAWFIGLDVEHVDDTTFCCGTSNCELMILTGNVCAASFDWQCSGICRPDERMFNVHLRCSEGEDVLWTSNFSKI